SGKTATISVTVTQLVTSITLDPSDDTDIIVGDTLVVTVTTGPEDATDATWTVSSSNSGVASVTNNNNGTFTISGVSVSADPVTITVTAGDDSGTSASITVTVVAAETGFSITTSEDTMYVGGESTFGATMTFTDSSTLTTGFTWSSSDETVATVDSESGTVTAVSTSSDTHTASVTIYAKYTYEGQEYTAEKTITILPGLVSVEITSSETAMNVGDTSTFVATVTYKTSSTETYTETSGVTWSSSETTYATVGDDTGLVTALAAGTTDIMATITYGGNTEEDTVSVEISNVLVSSISLSYGDVENATSGSVDIFVGDTLTVTVAVSPDNVTADPAWTVSSGNSEVASVENNGDGTFTISGVAVNADSVTITVSAADESGVSVTLTVTVVAKEESFTMTTSESTMYVGGESTFVATMTFSDDTTISEGFSWSSSNTSVATVDSNGTVTAVATDSTEHTATVTITAKYTYEGEDYEATATVTILPSFDSIEITTSTDSMLVGAEETFVATVTYKTSSSDTYTETTGVTWASSVTDYATVGEDTGLVTAVAAGDTNITASITYTGETYTSTAVTVSVSSFSISVDSATASIIAGNYQDITVTVTANNSSNTAWTASSNDTGVATVTESGEASGTLTITAVAAGTATITVAAAGDSSKTATIEVTVKAAVTASLEDATIYIPGNTATLSLTVSNADSYDVTWASSEESVATVEDGVVTAALFGSTTITATVTTNDGQETTATCTVLVSAEYFYLTGVGDNWSTYDTSADAEAAGMLLTSAGTDNVYSITLAMDPDSTPWGFQIIFSGIDGDWDYKMLYDTYYDSTGSSNSYVSGSSGNFAITTLGSYTITLNLNDGVAKVTIVYNEAVTVSGISITSYEDQMTVGDSYTFAATITYSDGTSYVFYDTATWTSSYEAAATVDEYGEVTAVATGETTITVSITIGGDTYSNSVVVTITDAN
ncbi:MAG: Ig-like domain-containing protein, partial [Clostridia bacterium]|nr:Ig-like domain-containing protein [Clostridia bacterium]